MSESSSPLDRCIHCGADAAQGCEHQATAAAPARKPASKKGALFAGLGVALLAVGGAAAFLLMPGVTHQAYLTVNASPREEPSESAAQQGALEADWPVGVLACKEGWCKIDDRGQRGWLKEAELTREPPTRFVWHADAPIRQLPDATSPVVRTHKVTESVALLRYEGEFARVRAGEVEGYVPTRWLVPGLLDWTKANALISPMGKDQAEEKIRIAAALVQASPANLQAHELVLVVYESLGREKELDAASAAMEQARGASEASKFQDQLKFLQGGLALSALSARAAPSFDAALVKELAGGDPISLIEEAQWENGTLWKKAAIDGKPAWVPANQVVVPSSEGAISQYEEHGEGTEVEAAEYQTLSEAGWALAANDFREVARTHPDPARRAELAKLLIAFLSRVGNAGIERPQPLTLEDPCATWLMFNDDQVVSVREKANEALLAAVKAQQEAFAEASVCAELLTAAVMSLARPSSTELERQQLKQLARVYGTLSAEAEAILAGKLPPAAEVAAPAPTP